MELSTDIAYWTNSVKANKDGKIDAIKKSKREFLIYLANKLTKTADLTVKIDLKV